MTAGKNDWQDMWDDANPTPFYKQKRLFDETQKAMAVIRELKEWTFLELTTSISQCFFQQIGQKLELELPEDISIQKLIEKSALLYRINPFRSACVSLRNFHFCVALTEHQNN